MRHKYRLFILFTKKNTFDVRSVISTYFAAIRVLKNFFELILFSLEIWYSLLARSRRKQNNTNARILWLFTVKILIVIYISVFLTSTLLQNTSGEGFFFLFSFLQDLLLLFRLCNIVRRGIGQTSSAAVRSQKTGDPSLRTSCQPF